MNLPTSTHTQRVCLLSDPKVNVGRALTTVELLPEAVKELAKMYTFQKRIFKFNTEISI